MQGIDLLAVAVHKPGTVRQNFFYEHTFMGSPRLPKVEGVVSREIKYMKFIEHGYEERYNLKNDPLEKRNLATNTAYQKQPQQMRLQYQKLKLEVQ